MRKYHGKIIGVLGHFACNEILEGHIWILVEPKTNHVLRSSNKFPEFSENRRWISKSDRAAEVAQLEHVLQIEENVRWLDVAMDHLQDKGLP